MSEKEDKSLMECLVGTRQEVWYKKGTALTTAFLWLNTCAFFWLLMFDVLSGPRDWFMFLFLFCLAGMVTFWCAQIDGCDVFDDEKE